MNAPLIEPAAADAQVAVGDLRTVAIHGGAAPREVGGTYHRIGPASVNDSGTVVFAAELSGAAAGSAIVRVTRGRHRVLLRAGDPAPGGGRYTGFGELDLGEDGSLLFHARLARCAAAEGVFLRTAAGTRVVARADGDFTGFGELTLTSFRLDGRPYFRLAYTARLADRGKQLVIWPSYRDPATVLTTGQETANGVLEDFTISRVGFAVCVVARIRLDAGSRQVALLASEDQTIWGPRMRAGARLPGLGQITRLLDPPGMYVHHGLIAVDLDGGGTALVTRSGGSDPEAFARPGDPAPGLPGQSIARFGPPLANHGLPAGGPCGVASLVTLDDGEAALWLGVFSGQQPMTGAAIVPLVAGDRTDDAVPARVEAFNPIKLTNAGTLLLRSTLDLGGPPTGGLLLLDRLFDWYQTNP